MATYGYARVSTTDQDLTIQIAALRAAVAAHVLRPRLEGLGDAALGGRLTTESIAPAASKVPAVPDGHAAGPVCLERPVSELRVGGLFGPRENAR